MDIEVDRLIDDYGRIYDVLVMIRDLVAVKDDDDSQRIFRLIQGEFLDLLDPRQLK